MSGAEQSKILEALGGKQNANVIASILKNTEDLEKTFEVIKESAGSVDEEMAVVMDTTEKKAEQVKNSFLELSSLFYDSSFTKELLDSTKGFLQLLSASESCVPVLTTILGLFAKFNTDKFIGMFSSIGKVFSKNMFTGGLDILRTLGMEFVSARKSGLSFGESLKSVANYANLSNISMNSLVQGLGLVASAVSIAYMAYKNYQRQQEEMERKALERAKSYKEESDNINELKNKYTEITNSTMSVTEKKSQLREIQAQLLETYGVEASGIDLVNGKYETQIGLLEKLKGAKGYDDSERILSNRVEDKQNDLNKLMKNNSFQFDLMFEVKDADSIVKEVNDKIGKPIVEMSKDLFGGKAFFKFNTKDVEEYKQALGELLTIMGSNGDRESVVYKEMNEQMEKLKQATDDLTEAQNEAYQNFYSKDTVDLAEKLGIKDLSNVTQKEANKMKEALSQVRPDADDKYVEYFNTFVDGMVKVEDQATKTGEALEKSSNINSISGIASTFNEAVDKVVAKKDTLNEAFNQLAESGSLTEEVIKNLAKQFPDLMNGVETVSDLMDNIEMERINQEVNDTIDEIQVLNSNIQALSEGQTLNAETTQNLINKYPELSSKITENNGVYSISEEVLQDVVNGLYTKTQATIDDEIQTTQAVRDGVMAKIQAYSQELSALKSIAEARNALYSMEQKHIESSKALSANAEGLTNNIFKNHNKTELLVNAPKYDAKAEEQYRFVKEQIEIYDEAQKKLDSLELNTKKLSMGTGAGNAKAKGGNGKPKSGGSKKEKKGEAESTWLNKQLKVIQSASKAIDDEITYIEEKLNIAKELGRTEEVKDYRTQLAELHNKKKATLHTENEGLKVLKSQLKEEENIVKVADLIRNNSNDWWREKKAQLDEEKTLIQEKYEIELNGINDRREALNSMYADIEVNPEESLSIEKERLELLKQEQEIAKNKLSDYLDLGLTDKTEEVRELRNELNSLNKQIIEQSITSLEMEINIKELKFDKADDIKKLLESSIEQAEYLEDMEKEIELRDKNVDIICEEIDYNKDLIKELRKKLSLEENGSAKYVKLEKEIQEALERENSLISELMSSYKELASAQAERSVYGDGGKEAWEKSYDKELQALKDKKDTLKDTDDLKEKEVDMQEKLLEIEQLRDKLAWLRTQRTVQALRQDENGDFQWNYETDAKAIADAEKELNDKLKDYNKSQEDLNNQREEDIIDAEIEALEKEKDAKDQAYEEAQDRYEKFYQGQLRTTIDGLRNVNSATKDNLDKVKATYTDRLKSIFDTVKEYCSMMKDEMASVGLEQIGIETNKNNKDKTNNKNSNSSAINKVLTPAKDMLNIFTGGLLNKVARFDTGGDIPDSIPSTGALAIVDRGEKILNRQNSKALNDILDTYSNNSYNLNNIALRDNNSGFQQQVTINELSLKNVNKPVDLYNELAGLKQYVCRK